MTNEEKYEEIFGIKPDHFQCPTTKCKDCPLNEVFEKRRGCQGYYARTFWWEAEYRKEINVEACKRIVQEGDREHYGADMR